LSETECSAWVDLFDATNGTGWSHCSDARLDPCGCIGPQSYYVWINCKNKHIAEIRLQNELSGTIPDTIGQLTSTYGITLVGNPKLAGTIPKTMATMTELTGLYLYDNDLTGIVPNLNFTGLGTHCGIGGTNNFTCPFPDGATDCNSASDGTSGAKPVAPCVPKYACVSNQCVSSSFGTSLANCNAACVAPTYYQCIGGKCEPAATGVSEETCNAMCR
jgi:hypothetical protein